MNYKADVVVVGGTPSGIACAIRCAREGLDVILVNLSNHLGGIMSSGLGVTDTLYDGFRAPVYETFIQKVRDYYKATYGEQSKQYAACYSKRKLHFEPHVAEHVLTGLVQAESRIKVLHRYYPVSVERSGRKLLAVNVRSFDDEPSLKLEADSFVDASYEGDLAAAAGVECKVGRENRDKYNEPHAGKIFTGQSGLFSRDATAGLLNLEPFSTVSQHIFAGSTGEGDNALQAYNFRVCLTCDPENRVYPSKPDSYDKTLYLGLVEKPDENRGTTFVLRSHLMLSDGSWGLSSHIPNDKLTWNDPLLLGAQLEYPNADWSRRNEIIREHADFALGMLYFLQNDEAVRPDVRREALHWGLPKDEFAENGHFPYELLVREGRRIAGRYIFTEHDGTLAPGLNRTPVHYDSVAIAEWPISSHDCTADRRPGSFNDGVLMLSESTRPSQIPYRSLLPKDIDNLLVTVCLSCSHVGWGTLRLEPVFMHVGESAGYAVALATELGTMPGKLDADTLVRRLADNRVMVSFFNEFDMLTGQDWVPAVQYFGTKGFFCGYDAIPEELLDRHSAGIWAKAFGSLLAGSLNPLETARKLYQERLQTEVADPVSGQQLRQYLEQELLALNLEGVWLDSIKENAAPLRRGEVCLLLYRLLSNISKQPQTLF
ncbi:FAD-dependent oxidoreductase [Paenibacillus agricola]|uniref:FAD-dependent oxidoreductase n=1 Tax=Paenibacillus agricola TaxID=2716264 RepID=A0ABX0JFR2_9BACL|nr:FAD-dependent oxidoreductase [Paenibacillus agricola]NHN32696.1 FAD-dependent oxidoreductase [Paenibacillus agricola]